MEKIEWPKFNEDNVISKEKYHKLRNFADQHGIAIAGFQRFDGSIEAVEEAISALAFLQREFPAVADERHKLTLILSHAMYVNDFAMTKGRHIYLNADAYRSLERLKEEYQNAVAQNWFIQGSDWKHIIHHEFGPILANIFKIDSLEIAFTILDEDEDVNMVMDYVTEHLSEYAAMWIDGREIISEVFSDIATQNPTEFSIKFYAKLRERIGGV